MARALLEAGANPNATTDDGRTPLHRAANVKMSRALLEAGANPNTADRRGRTPLHGFRAREAENVRVLLNAGADPDRADSVRLQRQCPVPSADAMAFQRRSSMHSRRRLGRTHTAARGDAGGDDPHAPRGWG
mmetsp:Transcript_26171/g.61715  ORF Transcript_26171/g.61715 Transcript_26171/m.61715 type:complete len:132 (-) Transcript_26171:303-698(-)